MGCCGSLFMIGWYLWFQFQGFGRLRYIWRRWRRWWKYWKLRKNTLLNNTWDSLFKKNSFELIHLLHVHFHFNSCRYQFRIFLNNNILKLGTFLVFSVFSYFIPIALSEMNQIWIVSSICIEEVTLEIWALCVLWFARKLARRQTDRHSDNISVFFLMKKAIKRRY